MTWISWGGKWVPAHNFSLVANFLRTIIEIGGNLTEVLSKTNWASECPDVKNYTWLLNPVSHTMLYSCIHMTTWASRCIHYSFRTRSRRAESVSVSSSALISSASEMVVRCWTAEYSNALCSVSSVCAQSLARFLHVHSCTSGINSR